MKSTWLALAAAAALAPWAASAVPAGGLPPQVCSGPAGENNPNCQPDGGPVDPDPGVPVKPGDADAESAVPEPGAAAAFALGALLVAARTRRR